ncbi:MAG TPA: hypothetical protein VFO28_02260, partial [Burkholderiaceae bacterium]|nr:hypothetical protein [Burkholderiaceae bacterium]
MSHGILADEGEAMARGLVTILPTRRRRKEPTARTGCRWIMPAAFVVAGTATQAQMSQEEMNASNNPLTPSIAFNLQDYYTARAYGLGNADSNALLLRGALPHKLFGMPQLLRATLPLVTT